MEENKKKKVCFGDGKMLLDLNRICYWKEHIFPPSKTHLVHATTVYVCPTGDVYATSLFPSSSTRQKTVTLTYLNMDNKKWRRYQRCKCHKVERYFLFLLNFLVSLKCQGGPPKILKCSLKQTKSFELDNKKGQNKLQRCLNFVSHNLLFETKAT